MKNPMEVLRAKEADISRVQREIQALRVAAKLLGDDSEPSEKNRAEANPPVQSQTTWRVPRDSSSS